MKAIMKFKKIFAVVCSILLFSIALLAGCSDGSTPSEGPGSTLGQSEAKKADEVFLQYDGKDINGTLTVALSLRTVQLGAVALCDYEEIEDAVITYESNNTDVAVINRRGTVTLISAGEAVITATAEGVSHKIVLIVDDGNSEATYTITVNGGRASETRAFAGEIITLSASVPMHKVFEGWNFPYDVTWISGNQFRMPASDVVISANYTDTMYTLDVVGAVITQATTKEGTVVPKGEDAGNTENGNQLQYDITSYEFAYGTELTLEPVAVAGKTFVGIENANEGARLDDVTAIPYEFKMFGGNTMLKAVYATEKQNVLTAVNTFNDVSRGYKTITAGVPEGESADADLDGKSGYRLAIPANTAAQTKINFTATGLASLTERQSLQVTIKNRYSEPISLSVYMEKLGMRSESEPFTVQPGETVNKLVVKNLMDGYNWNGSTKVMTEQTHSVCLTMEKALGGEATDTALVDVVVSAANLYPDGDILFATQGEEAPQQAKFSANSIWYGKPEGGSNLRRPEYSENMTEMLAYWAPSDFHTDGSEYYIRNNLTNVPTGTNKLYVRIVNVITVRETFGAGYRIVISSDAARTDIIGEETIMITEKGQVSVFAIELKRTITSSDIISYQPVVPNDLIDNSGPYSIVMQVFYNNVIGVEE